MKTKGRKSGCKAQTKAGKRCRAAPTAGGLCFFHANPNKASELGRIGGRSKRSAAAGNGDALPALDNAAAVVETGARLITDAYWGRLDPRVAASLAPLLSLQLRAIATSALEERVAQLEKKSAEARPDGKDGQLSRLDFSTSSASSPNPKAKESREDPADEVQTVEEG